MVDTNTTVADTKQQMHKDMDSMAWEPLETDIGVDTCRHNTCLSLLLFREAPMGYLIRSLLTSGICDLPRFHPVFNMFTNSYHIYEICRRTPSHLLIIQPLKRTHEDINKFVI